MKYLFTGKEVKVGDIARVFCDKEHLKGLNIPKYFEDCNSVMTDVNALGIKVVKVSPTRCRGYMVHRVKFDNVIKVVPYKMNGKLIYLNVTSGNVIGLMKYIQ